MKSDLAPGNMNACLEGRLRCRINLPRRDVTCWAKWLLQFWRIQMLQMCNMSSYTLGIAWTWAARELHTTLRLEIVQKCCWASQLHARFQCKRKIHDALRAMCSLPSSLVKDVCMARQGTSAAVPCRATGFPSVERGRLLLAGARFVFSCHSIANLRSDLRLPRWGSVWPLVFSEASPLSSAVGAWEPPCRQFIVIMRIISPAGRSRLEAGCACKAEEWAKAQARRFH